jgi:hypothetical protein
MIFSERMAEYLSASRTAERRPSDGRQREHRGFVRAPFPQ